MAERGQLIWCGDDAPREARAARLEVARPGGSACVTGSRLSRAGAARAGSTGRAAQASRACL